MHTTPIFRGNGFPGSRQTKTPRTYITHVCAVSSIQKKKTPLRTYIAHIAHIFCNIHVTHLVCENDSHQNDRLSFLHWKRTFSDMIYTYTAPCVFPGVKTKLSLPFRAYIAHILCNIHVTHLFCERASLGPDKLSHLYRKRTSSDMIYMGWLRSVGSMKL